MQSPTHYVWALALFTLSVIGTIAAPIHAEDTSIDAYGRLKRIGVGEGWLDIQTDLRIPSLGWKDYVALGSSATPGEPLASGDRTWQTTLANDSGLNFDVEQKVRSLPNILLFDVSVTSKTARDIEGVYFWIDLAEDQFAGGTYRLGRHSGELPVGMTDGAELSKVFTDHFMFTDSTSKMSAAVTLSQPTWVLIKDQRKYGENYSAFVMIHPGTLDKSDRAHMRILIQSGGITDDVAHAKLNADSVRYTFAGFGGNYAFAVDSPVTQYTLEHMKVAMARTAMSLADWEPERPNDGGAGDPRRPDWNRLIEQDKPGSRLQREFTLMRELSQRKIPYVASVWSLPPWMYEQPPQTSDADGNHFAAKMWPDVLGCVTSYLLYAKEKYQAEPDYFSFNEPDIGIKVKFSAEEHQAAIKKLSAEFKRLGLRTKPLLGDVSNPRQTINYAQSAAADTETVQAAGALGVHSWGNASPSEYSAWAALAQKLQLPLFITEAGVDPFAWHDGRFQTFENGMREMMQYQRLLQYACPQSILFWEYTDDYSLLTREKGGEGHWLITPRLCFQKQFCDLTPPGSEALTVTSDRPAIALSAFRHPAHNDDPRGYTIHIGNQLWPRKLVIDGIPSEIQTLNAVHTTREDLYKEIEPVEVHDGKVELDLPAQSMTTLTTLDVPAFNR